MSRKVIDASQLAQMFIQGGANLTKHAKVVDALNVFPVPDGDTGTNMNLTITSGVKEVRQAPVQKVSTVAQAFSKGLLMGARGNSGVILSQLFRGFAKGVEGKSSIDGKELAAAFELGVTTAYKAVMKPVEGTILTVAKDSAKAAGKFAKKSDDALAMMESVLTEAKASLKRTPDLLPVLKEVGVVDSGGQGLVYIYEGFLAVLKGETIVSQEVETPSMEDLVKIEHHNAQSMLATEDIEFGYCTEVMVKFDEEKLKASPFSENDFRKELDQLGDSLLVVSDEDLLKVHIHAESPGEILNCAQRYGNLINIKIENMREQHTHLLDETKAAYGEDTTTETPKEKSEYGVVTVSMGEGIEELFKGLGATVVIPGGQTMNPSTEDIVTAIHKTNAHKVVVLPNNGNIIMAAEQAAQVADAEVIVVPSKTVPQGLAALLAFNPLTSLENNSSTMKDAMSNVKTGQVTYAVRDTNMDGIEIKKDDFMGISEKTIISSGPALVEVTKKLLENMLDEGSEILTIIWGEGTTEETVAEITSYVAENFEEIEVEIHEGKQPLYSFIFSVE
ncbi:DAK2 domain-containing protein [Alkalihalobacterium chitinilyticum]|uniref:DAK2 domain-containing protein n=1 Tax=Alkalihalobacterium chitinilyticum TaxID=2980103 RepID=A0ABT5VFM9_9BACI|nr:DAK2 domain-containing protein [Alkalihalobacterium chitinilyticum]MDE5413009.1 DAK2 domain-containing protein [Alkalihalobacterium chitinilyticum]